MPSTYSPTLRIELIGAGEQDSTWGTTTNSNLGTLIEQAITGVQTITMVDADYTLTAYNGLVDESRNAVLVIAGANMAVRSIIAPNVEKTYVIKNSTSGGYGVTIKTASGVGVTVPNGATQIVFCNGTDFYLAASQTNIVAGTGIGVLTSGIDATVTNTGVTSIAGTANQVVASANTGGVTLSLPSTINVNTSGNAATATNANTAAAATTLATTNWTVLESGGFLYFRYGGVNKMRLDSNGNIVLTGNVTAYGSI